MKLPRGGEWTPRGRSWSFIQTRSGIGYWQQPDGPRELFPGSCLVLPQGCRGVLRASQLNEVEIAWFQIDPEQLAGLLSLEEQRSLQRMDAREEPPVRFLSPREPVAERFRRLGSKPAVSTSSLRLQLLQLFLEAVKPELDQTSAPVLPAPDGRGRLRRFLRETAGAEFLKMSLGDLAPKMHCSPRHLSRLFIEEVGVPFRRKQTELRLARARELLATSDVKVADVAAASGYESVSLFSLLFKKYFGLSPGRWRQHQRETTQRRPKSVRLAPLCA